MSIVKDPKTGLEFYELSHVWNQNVPSYPGRADVAMRRAVKHAQHGVLAWEINTSMHTGTHMVAPIHVLQKSEDLAAISVDRLFGNGVVLDLRSKGSFDIITADDLKAAGEIKDGDIVVINTGWHKRYSDALEYFGEAPGLDTSAAEYLASKNPKFVAMDTPFIDSPLATDMVSHRGGPHMKRLEAAYKDATGKDAKTEFPERFPAQIILAKGGIPVVLQAGDQIEEVTGKRVTLAATPWKFDHGDACPVRFVAIVDPSGSVKIDSGN